MKPKKLLQDLNLLDRFLFAEAMEDPENMRTLLEIILGRDVMLKELPQTEKEQRSSPLYRFVKLDVWAKDMEDTVYNTEVQKTDTKNLPKRSRFYQSLIDGKLLEPGEIDFNKLNSVYVIVITAFDVFGRGKYRYTFRMNCEEFPELNLGDGAVRIFLNTQGTNPGDVNPELVELLQYMQNTTQETADSCHSERIRNLQGRIAAIKSNEEVNVRYMQEWEERELDKQEARREGERNGKKLGERNQLKKLISKKLQKGLPPEAIAELLEEDLNVIQELIDELTHIV